MFFIAKGDCVVKVKDKLDGRNVEMKVRKLFSGDHFGVSLLSVNLIFIGNINDLLLQTIGHSRSQQLLHARENVSDEVP